jgi:hypothetical protein
MYGNTSIYHVNCTIAYIDIVFVQTIIMWISFHMNTIVFNGVVDNNT